MAPCVSSHRRIRNPNTWRPNDGQERQTKDQRRGRLRERPLGGPRPSNANWPFENSIIGLCSGEEINDAADEDDPDDDGDQRQMLTYSQLGLIDSRSGKPSKQWELLRLFAREHGVMTWFSPGACRQNRKRRELLNKSLQQFFDIDGEPIELTDDRKGWRCLFKVQDEN